MIQPYPEEEPKPKKKLKLKPESKHTKFHKVSKKPKPTKQTAFEPESTKPERIKQKLRELETEKNRILSQFEKSTARANQTKNQFRPSRKCELTPIEVKTCFIFLASIILFAIPNFIFPNIYGLGFCVASTLAFLLVLFMRLFFKPKT